MANRLMIVRELISRFGIPNDPYGNSEAHVSKTAEGKFAIISMKKLSKNEAQKLSDKWKSRLSSSAVNEYFSVRGPEILKFGNDYHVGTELIWNKKRSSTKTKMAKSIVIKAKKKGNYSG